MVSGTNFLFVSQEKYGHTQVPIGWEVSEKKDQN
jgi:hypothetical protein